MASTTDATAPSSETPITIKVVFEGNNRKFKLPLHDLTASAFADKIRSILQIENGQNFVLERFSDSGNAYITLDQSNPSAYKQLYRAAKAKGKLRIRATLVGENMTAAPAAAASQRTSTKLPIMSGRASESKAATSARDFSCLHARDQFFQQLANISRDQKTEASTKEAAAPALNSSSFWQIFCNNCDKAMADAHFHCSICDGGDYDLCESCVESGKICPGEGHWLIKRFIKSGNIVTSATETIAPKPREPVAQKAPVVPAPTSAPLPKGWEQKTARDGAAYYVDHNTRSTTWVRPNAATSAASVQVVDSVTAGEANRTCNACVKVLPESALLTCKDCPDYDLCEPCLKVEEGHHPGHSFESIVPSATLSHKVCSAGRQTRHHAICDGCDEPIYGVRHKCLTCPDWDYCSKCHDNVATSHPGHRFVPVYSNIEVAPASGTIHYGILCDGPLCINKPGKAYIRGIRYKCAICDDTDYCANCEAHPSTKHNGSHPMIKFKTAVRGAHVTVIDDAPGRQTQVHGDAARRPQNLPTRSVRTTATSPPPYTPAAVEKVAKSTATTLITASTDDLDAHFVTDIISDGSKIVAGGNFKQAWTLRNPGPNAWPQGTMVSFVGGDNMSRDEMLTSNATTVPIAAGEQYQFEVSMQAPVRPGKHISYWRLKAPNGLPFGHKLWCDIEVEAPTMNRSPIRTSPNMVEEFKHQLMLLEQQNKQRLMAARQTQSRASESATDAQSSASIKNEGSPARSVMVFPTLEKESPAASTVMTPVKHVLEETTKADDVKSEAATETETATTTNTVADHEEHFEDLESVEYDDSESENDGFLTDDEYDILDASDDDVLSNRGRSVM